VAANAGHKSQGMTMFGTKTAKKTRSNLTALIALALVAILAASPAVLAVLNDARQNPAISSPAGSNVLTLTSGAAATPAISPQADSG
jgi:hypothetical protein